jgi:hypothetical protein
MSSKKKSSEKASSEAAKILQDKNSSGIQKKLARSVLSQANPDKQTALEMETIASKVLQSTKYSDDTKSLAGSVLSQADPDKQTGVGMETIASKVLQSTKYSVTIPISTTLDKRLKEVAKIQNKSEQELILEALESHLNKISPNVNCYDLLQELGIFQEIEGVDLPSDLSTNPKYFDNFGTL